MRTRESRTPTQTTQRSTSWYENACHGWRPGDPAVTDRCRVWPYLLLVLPIAFTLILGVALT